MQSVQTDQVVGTLQTSGEAKIGYQIFEQNGCCRRYWNGSGSQQILPKLDHFTEWREVFGVPRIDAPATAMVIFHFWISVFWSYQAH